MRVLVVIAQQVVTLLDVVGCIFRELRGELLLIIRCNVIYHCDALELVMWSLSAL